jgi:hypothetical protein
MSWVEETLINAFCGARDAAALDAAQMGALSSTEGTAAAAETACRAALTRGAEALEDELLRWPRGAAQSLVAHAARADDGDAVAVLCRVGGAKPEALREACESNAWKVAATLLVCGADATGAAHVARRCGHAHLAMAIDAGLDAQLTNGATLRAYASRRGDGYALAGYCAAARNRNVTDRATHLRPAAPPLLAGVAPAVGGSPDVAEAYELVVTTTTPSSGARKGDAVALPCTIGRGGDLELRDTSCVVRVVAAAVVPAPGDAPWCRVWREGTRQKNSWAEPSRRQAVAVLDRAVPRGCGARLAAGEALRVGKTTLQLRARTAPVLSPPPPPPAPPAPVVATVVSARPTTSDAYARALIERAGRAIDAERERLRQRLSGAPPAPLPGATDAERWRLRQRLAHERPTAAPPPADDGHVRVWELVAPKHDTVGLGHVAAPTVPSSRAPGRRAAEMALARHRYDRGPAASSAPRPASGGVAFVRPAAFGVELNEEDSGPSDLPPAPAPYELRPAAPKKRRTSSNKRVKFSE